MGANAAWWLIIVAAGALTSACRTAPSPAAAAPAGGTVAPIVSAAPVTPAAPVAPVAPAAPVVDVRMSPQIVDGTLTGLAIEVGFRADAAGHARLRLPSEWASERALWTYVRDLRVDGARAVTEDGPAVRVIDAAPGAALVARYRIVSAYAADPAATVGQPFAPIIRPTWFYAFGQALFALPEVADATRATFTWTGAPAGFGFASDLERVTATDGTVGDLIESIAIGGPALTVHGAPGATRVAVVGAYAFPVAAFVDATIAVMAGERAMWGDGDTPYLVALAPLTAVDGHRSIGGTGCGDAFAVTMAVDTELAPVRALIAHELFHTWNPDQVGGQQDGAGEPAGKWFSEGFTDFYAPRLLLRTGAYTLADFVDHWNASLLAYAISPVRDQPNARIVRDYWTDPAVNKLPYLRGQLLAARWDHRLRRATAGARDLDDVMRAMRTAVRAGDLARRAPDAASLFPSTYVEVGGPAVDADLDRLVARGERITLPPDAFGPCLRVTSARRPVFERGWDAEATTAAGNVVTGLRRGSAAYRAGLRDGMTIEARTAGTPGDATVRYTLRVRDGARVRTITYLPRGPGSIDVQRLVVTRAGRGPGRAACLSVIAGAAPR